MSLGLFVLAVLGTAVWVRWPRPAPEDRVFLRARDRIPGYHFQPVALGTTVSETLATTNLLNGHFFDAHSNRVSVFSAAWEPGQGTGANVFGHTPEICWVGAGFRTIRVGEPDRLALSLAGRSIPFQCRVLQHPELPMPEITLWAACLDGRWEVYQFSPPPDLSRQSATTATYLGEAWRYAATRLSSLQRLIHRPFTQNARKQFIRFSMPLGSDWQTTLRELEVFAAKWLEVPPGQVAVVGAPNAAYSVLPHPSASRDVATGRP